MYIKATMVN
uniref:Uncharacterized protein n=1 Tax=Rhizophora mucronata TaxID=61149 RepID=A0A2P2PFJ7_RHIMU